MSGLDRGTICFRPLLNPCPVEVPVICFFESGVSISLQEGAFTSFALTHLV